MAPHLVPERYKKHHVIRMSATSYFNQSLDIDLWLREFVAPKEYGEWMINPIMSKKHGTIQYVEVRVKHSEHALLFKLRFTL